MKEINFSVSLGLILFKFRSLDSKDQTLLVRSSFYTKSGGMSLDPKDPNYFLSKTNPNFERVRGRIKATRNRISTKLS